MNRSLFIPFVLLLLLPFNLVLSQTTLRDNTKNPLVSKSVVHPPTASMTTSLDSIKTANTAPTKKHKKEKKKWEKGALIIGSGVILTRIVFHIRWLIIKNREE